MRIIEWNENHGDIVYPEGFKARLVGKNIDEQMKCFRTAGSSNFRSTGWSDRTNTRYKSLEKDSEVRAVVVREGFIAGIIVKNDNGEECFVGPEKGVCTYYAEDNNGAGYKTRADYTYLICVPENIE